MKGLLVGGGLAIGAFFALARKAAKDAELEELEVQSRLMQQRKQHVAKTLREEHLLRKMRETSAAQMGIDLSRYGLFPLSRGSLPNEAYIQAAAARRV